MYDGPPTARKKRPERRRAARGPRGLRAAASRPGPGSPKAEARVDRVQKIWRRFLCWRFALLATFWPWISSHVCLTSMRRASLAPRSSLCKRRVPRQAVNPGLVVKLPATEIWYRVQRPIQAYKLAERSDIASITVCKSVRGWGEIVTTHTQANTQSPLLSATPGSSSSTVPLPTTSGSCT